MKALMTVLAMALLAPIAQAAPARDKLAGVNDVPFGASFEAAKTKLGASAKADTDPSDPTIKILLVSGMTLFGERVSLNYTFGAKGAFSEAYAIASLPTGDFSVCRAHWTSMLGQLAARYGVPDTQGGQLDARTPSQNVEFKFQDGARITADLLGCLIEVSYLAPGR